MRSHSLRIAMVAFIAAMLMQSAWLFALPPFEGNDEVDHAYRATSVAAGNWRPSGISAAHGRGDLVQVPEHIVRAARPVCQTLRYYGPDNCTPISSTGDGSVTVAASATRYHPAFYWVTGSMALPFEGTQALYAMRITAMTLCALMVAGAAWACTVWARTMWPLMALFVSLTPMVLFSNTVVAPNGLEMSSAIVVWSCMLGLGSRLNSASDERKLLVCATVGAVVLTTVRSLGPLWLALIILSSGLLLGRSSVMELYRRHRRLLIGITVAVFIFTAASTWWIMAEHFQLFDSPMKGTASAEEAIPPATQAVASASTAQSSGRKTDSLVWVVLQIPVWIIQSIGTFPRRNDAAPSAVYMAELLALTLLFLVGYWAGKRKVKLLVLGTGFLSLAIPMAFTFTIAQNGSWQGRYTLPFAFGFVLLLGYSLDQADPHHRSMPLGVLAGFLTIGTSHVLSAVTLLGKQRNSNPFAGEPAWLVQDTWLVASLMIAGLLCWALVYRTGRAAPQAVMPAGDSLVSN